MTSSRRSFATASAEALEEHERLIEEKRRQDIAEIAAARQSARQEQVEAALNKAGVPPRFRSRTFNTYRAETEGQRRALAVCRNYAQHFAQALADGTCLMLCGNPGCGKTHLAVAVLNQIIGERHSGIFVSVSEVLRMIRDSYKTDRTEADVYDSLIKPDLLVLDEVGVSIGDSDKRRAMLFDLFNARYNAMKPVLLIGNLTQEEMDQYLGDRVADRLREGGGTSVAFDWDSYRRGRG